jgi:tRNA(fMet)-specific endonuclease VapC
MKRYLLDTNICLAYLKQNKLYKDVEQALALSSAGVIIMISVVTKAELMALGKKNGWGKPKLNQLNQYLNNLIILDISETDHALIDIYSDVDAYSQGKLKANPLGTSAKNMGKNDLWIAATAKASGAELITSDGDFDHLNHPGWIRVHKFAV